MGVCHHPNAHERGPRRVSGPSMRKFGDKKLRNNRKTQQIFAVF
jgi:hypothetical protein